MRTIIFLYIVMMASCSPPVVFDQAYPPNQEDLKSIPEFFQGAFICESDSALLLISKNYISLHQTHYFNTDMKYIEQREDCKIVDDKIYVTGREECIPITIVNDSLVRGSYTDTDTLFMIQKGSVARIHNGHLVINQELKPREWSISLLTPELGGDITYKAITDKSKIKSIAKVTRMADITTENDDSPRYKVRPTMKEFDELLAADNILIECEYLVRVQLENLFLN
jgi:hypothetical protein